MRPKDALLHEQDKDHRRWREEGYDVPVVSDWGDQAGEDDGWGDRTGLGALDNRKFEGSVVTMPTRVASWMRGVELATKGGEKRWKMEDDYQVEEYTPLAEWTQGWGETWALSSTASTGGARRGVAAAAPAGPGTLPFDSERVGCADRPGDAQFLSKVDRLKQPSDRLQTRWVEFNQLSTNKKIERIQRLVREIRGPFH